MILDKLKQDETLLCWETFNADCQSLLVPSGGTWGRLGRLIYFRAFGNSRSPPVRAGLAFSGEADRHQEHLLCVVEPMEGGAPRRKGEGLAELAPPFGSRRTVPARASSATPDK
jgi:hypothetical protein